MVVGLALDLEGTVMMRCRDDEERSKEINIKLLLKELTKRECRPQAHGIATCFPDTLFDNAPTQADLGGSVIGEKELKWLKEYLRLHSYKLKHYENFVY